MDYRIVELEGFKLAGVKMSSTNENQQGMKDCEAFWNQFISGNKQEAVAPLINREPFGVIGASFYNVDPEDSKKFDYYIEQRIHDWRNDFWRTRLRSLHAR